MNFWTIAVMIASIAGSAMSHAAELIVLASQGNLPGVNELAAAFARSSGYKVTVFQEEGKALEQRLSNGPADLITGNPPAMEALLDTDGGVALVYVRSPEMDAPPVNVTGTPDVVADITLPISACAPVTDTLP